MACTLQYRNPTISAALQFFFINAPLLRAPSVWQKGCREQKKKCCTLVIYVIASARIKNNDRLAGRPINVWPDTSFLFHYAHALSATSSISHICRQTNQELFSVFVPRALISARRSKIAALSSFPRRDSLLVDPSPPAWEKKKAFSPALIPLAVRNEWRRIASRAFPTPCSLSKNIL